MDETSRVQLKQETLVGNELVLENINPKSNTASIDDSNTGMSLEQTIDFMWNAINNKLARVVNSVNGRTGVVVLDSDDVGLGNVDNVSFADIKQWVLDQLVLQFGQKRIKLFNSLDEVLARVDQNILVDRDCAFFSDHGFMNQDGSKADYRSYIGYFYLDTNTNLISYQAKALNTIGATDHSIIYNENLGEDKDYEFGKLGINIWLQETALKLYSTYLKENGETTKAENLTKDKDGLMIDKQAIQPEFYYIGGMYGDNPDNDYAMDIDSALVKQVNDYPEEGRLLIVFDHDSYDIEKDFTSTNCLTINEKFFEENNRHKARRQLKRGDFIFCNFKDYRDENGNFPSGGTATNSIWYPALVNRNSALGIVTQVPDGVGYNDWVIHFATIIPKPGPGLEYLDKYYNTNDLTREYDNQTNNKDLRVSLMTGSIDDGSTFSNVSGLQVNRDFSYPDHRNYVRTTKSTEDDKNHSKVETPSGPKIIQFADDSSNGGVHITTDQSLAIMPWRHYGWTDGEAYRSPLVDNWCAISPNKIMPDPGEHFDENLEEPSLLGVNLSKIVLSDNNGKEKYINASGLRVSGTYDANDDTSGTLPKVWSKWGYTDYYGKNIEDAYSLDKNFITRTGDKLIDALIIYHEIRSRSEHEYYITTDKVGTEIDGVLYSYYNAYNYTDDETEIKNAAWDKYVDDVIKVFNAQFKNGESIDVNVKKTITPTPTGPSTPSKIVIEVVEPHIYRDTDCSRSTPQTTANMYFWVTKATEGLLKNKEALKYISYLYTKRALYVYQTYNSGTYRFDLPNVFKNYLIDEIRNYYPLPYTFETHTFNYDSADSDSVADDNEDDEENTRTVTCIYEKNYIDAGIITQEDINDIGDGDNHVYNLYTLIITRLLDMVFTVTSLGPDYYVDHAVGGLSVNVGDYLEIEPGIEGTSMDEYYSGGKVNVRLGKGLTGETVYYDSEGSRTGGNKITIDTGNGPFGFYDHELSMNVGNGITLHRPYNDEAIQTVEVSLARENSGLFFVSDDVIPDDRSGKLVVNVGQRLNPDGTSKKSGLRIKEYNRFDDLGEQFNNGKYTSNQYTIIRGGQGWAIGDTLDFYINQIHSTALKAIIDSYIAGSNRYSTVVMFSAKVKSVNETGVVTELEDIKPIGLHQFPFELYGKITFISTSEQNSPVYVEMNVIPKYEQIYSENDEGYTWDEHGYVSINNQELAADVVINDDNNVRVNDKIADKIHVSVLLKDADGNKIKYNPELSDDDINTVMTIELGPGLIIVPDELEKNREILNGISVNLYHMTLGQVYAYFEQLRLFRYDTNAFSRFTGDFENKYSPQTFKEWVAFAKRAAANFYSTESGIPTMDLSVMTNIAEMRNQDIKDFVDWMLADYPVRVPKGGLDDKEIFVTKYPFTKYGFEELVWGKRRIDGDMLTKKCVSYVFDTVIPHSKEDDTEYDFRYYQTPSDIKHILDVMYENKTGVYTETSKTELNTLITNGEYDQVSEFLWNLIEEMPKDEFEEFIARLYGYMDEYNAHPGLDYNADDMYLKDEEYEPGEGDTTTDDSKHCCNDCRCQTCINYCSPENEKQRAYSTAQSHMLDVIKEVIMAYDDYASEHLIDNYSNLYDNNTNYTIQINGVDYPARYDESGLIQTVLARLGYNVSGKTTFTANDLATGVIKPTGNWIVINNPKPEDYMFGDIVARQGHCEIVCAYNSVTGTMYPWNFDSSDHIVNMFNCVKKFESEPTIDIPNYFINNKPGGSDSGNSLYTKLFRYRGENIESSESPDEGNPDIHGEIIKNATINVISALDSYLTANGKSIAYNNDVTYEVPIDGETIKIRMDGGGLLHGILQYINLFYDTTKQLHWADSSTGKGEVLKYFYTNGIKHDNTTDEDEAAYDKRIINAKYSDGKSAYTILTTDETWGIFTGVKKNDLPVMLIIKKDSVYAFWHMFYCKDNVAYGFNFGNTNAMKKSIEAVRDIKNGKTIAEALQEHGCGRKLTETKDVAFFKYVKLENGTYQSI